MKEKEKKRLLILVIAAVLIIAIIFLLARGKGNNESQEQNNQNEEFVKVLDDGTKLNISTKLNEPKIFEGLTIKNIQFTNKGQQSVLLATVINNTNEDTDLKEIYLYLYDKNGNEIDKLQGIISPVKAGENIQLNIVVMSDYANAYDFKVEAR